jgi:hypothetical protein
MPVHSHQMLRHFALGAGMRLIIPYMKLKWVVDSVQQGICDGLLPLKCVFSNLYSSSRQTVEDVGAMRD